jgi:hypothetical protein
LTKNNKDDDEDKEGYEEEDEGKYQKIKCRWLTMKYNRLTGSNDFYFDKNDHTIIIKKIKEIYGGPL